jgi:7-cyano-7-deazaguanine reductase
LSNINSTLARATALRWDEPLNHVLHRVAAQRRGTRLAQHPAHGVDHVGFAAAVWTDDGDQLTRHFDRSRVDEGFESDQLYLSKAHRGFVSRKTGFRPDLFRVIVNRYNSILTLFSGPRMRAKPSNELKTFDNPSPRRDYLIHMEIPEFTCLCPLTGQPDFARLVLDYVPDRKCLELKNLKLYIWSYRNQGAFHEAVTNRILDDLARASRPRYMRLQAQFNVRGGIFTTVLAEHRKKGWKPQAAVDLPRLPASASNPPCGTDGQEQNKAVRESRPGQAATLRKR